MTTNSYSLHPEARIWIEQPIEEVTGLVEYQSRLKNALPGFIPDKPEKLHVTFLHLGKPQSLYAEMKAAGACLSYAEFTRWIQPVLKAAATAVQKPVKLSTKDLAVFGPDAHLSLVARLNPDPKWLKLRSATLNALFEFLSNAGVRGSINWFMKTNPNLRFGTRSAYQPHVTLGSIPLGVTTVGVERPPSELILGPTRLRMAGVS